VASVIAAVMASAVAAVAAWPSPLEASAEVLMQWTPVPMAEFVLVHLGGIARPAALLGALAIFMLCGGVSGVLAAAPAVNRPGTVIGTVASASFLTFIMVFLLRPSTILPDVWLVAVFVCALALVRTRPSQASNRRQFLERSAVILGGAGLLVSLFSVEPLLQAIATRKLFPFSRARGLALNGITDLVTIPGDFYVMDKVLQYPQVGPPAWQLSINGAIDRPVEFDYETLLNLPRESRYITMECVDNPVGGHLIGNAMWTGVPVKHLLSRVGARGDTVIFHGLDSYPESTSTHELIERNALIAYGMNGETLPRAHGFPARLILPGIYGFKSVKWLTRLEVVRGSSADPWHSHGWTETAVVHATTRIDVAHRIDSTVTLAGIAFAGNRGVGAVEVRVNGGRWRRAALGPVLSHEAWVQWAIGLQGRGPATFEARLIDTLGRTQSARRHAAYPDGSSGWAEVTV
jgi:DMSO/TMAO reductase YedYZ molybdopterin-dependent catalytic subunit